jgi:hypothetical protein
MTATIEVEPKASEPAATNLIPHAYLVPTQQKVSGSIQTAAVRESRAYDNLKKRVLTDLPVSDDRNEIRPHKRLSSRDHLSETVLSKTYDIPVKMISSGECVALTARVARAQCH